MADLFQAAGLGWMGEDSGCHGPDPKTIFFEQAAHRRGGEPAQVGAIQQPAVLVVQLAQA